MRHRSRFWRFPVLLVVAAMLFAACGSDKKEASGGSTDEGASTAANKTVKIGVIAPLSGSLSALGLGIKNSVDLAIKQANDRQEDPRLDASSSTRRGRHGQARRRRPGGHQARLATRPSSASSAR